MSEETPKYTCLWDKLKRPPASALKAIGGGRLKGMTDISPQWRYQALTEALGPCGVGWKFTIDRLWNECGPDGIVFAFAQVSLFVNIDGWSEGIPGVGGSMLVDKEKSGLHGSDEAFKMAVTDALSVAMKMIGVAADIYLGNWDGSKYKEPPVDKNAKISAEQADDLQKLVTVVGADADKFLEYISKLVKFEVKAFEDVPARVYAQAVLALEAKGKK